MPNFPIPDGYSSIDYLKETTIKGLIDSMHIKFKNEKRI